MMSSRRQNLCDVLFWSALADDNHKLHYLLPGEKISFYNLRHDRAFELPLINTDRFKNTFIPSSIKHRQYLHA